MPNPVTAAISILLQSVGSQNVKSGKLSPSSEFHRPLVRTGIRTSVSMKGGKDATHENL